MKVCRGVTDLLLFVAGVLVMVLCLSAVFAFGPDQAAGKKGYDSFFMSASGDRSRVLFVTGNRLDPLDRDEYPDVYESRNGRVRLISVTPSGRSGKGRISQVWNSGTEARSIFISRASFSPIDRDTEFDLYEVNGDEFRLISPDSAFTGDCLAVTCNFGVRGTTPDGSTIYLRASDRLTAEDSDSHTDFYGLTDGTLKLISGGPQAGGADSHPVDWSLNSSDDGSRVYFQTREALVPEDTDGDFDLYLHTSGGTELVSNWPSPEQNVEAMFPLEFSKQDPSRFYFSTATRFDGTPEDAGRFKLYVSEGGGQPTLIASSETGSSYFSGESPDGQTVYFTSVEQLTEDDHDDYPDLYARRDGQVELLSVGPRGSEGGEDSNEIRVLETTADGGIYFTSTDQLVAADDDRSIDLYLKAGANVSLISVAADGSNQDGYDLSSIQILEGGARIIMSTSSPWTSDDRDPDGNDLYVRQGDRLRLITKGPINDQVRRFPYGPDTFRSFHGDKYIFETANRLVRHDSDDRVDVYAIDLSKKNSTRLLSDGALRITEGPVDDTDPGPVRFRFQLRGKKPGFMCSIDESKARPCKSPAVYRNLEPGRHSFRVYSVGASGLGKWITVERNFRMRRFDTEPDRDPGASLISVSANGSRAVLETSLRLSRKDRDEAPDIYSVSATGSRKLVSPGASPNVKVMDVSADGSRVIYRSPDRIVPADDDQQSDLYQWGGSKTRLLPGGLNLFDKPWFGGATADGRSFMFSTRQQLSPADADQATDVYISSPDGITLISGGISQGDDAIPARMSGDGSAAVFRTSERLVPADTDDELGLYWSDGSEIRMITSGGRVDKNHGNSPLDPRVVGMSTSGSVVTILTSEKLLPEDSNESADVYNWSKGGLSLLSESYTRQRGDYFRVPTVRYGNDEIHGEIWPDDYNRRQAISADGGTVVIQTDGSLLREDADTGTDIYVSRQGDLDLIGPGSTQDSDMGYLGASRDFRTIVVETTEQLTKSDRDRASDIFRIRGSKVTMISLGGSKSGEWRHFVPWVSADGNRILLRASRSPYDVKNKGGRVHVNDLYMWEKGRLNLLSKWSVRGRESNLREIEAGRSGKIIWIETKSRLLPGDRDEAVDVYRLGPKGLLKVS